MKRVLSQIFHFNDGCHQKDKKSSLVVFCRPCDEMEGIFEFKSSVTGGGMLFGRNWVRYQERTGLRGGVPHPSPRKWRGVWTKWGGGVGFVSQPGRCSRKGASSQPAAFSHPGFSPCSPTNEISGSPKVSVADFPPSGHKK